MLRGFVFGVEELITLVSHGTLYRWVAFGGFDVRSSIDTK
jgi:hypothetical protein